MSNISILEIIRIIVKDENIENLKRSFQFEEYSDFFETNANLENILSLQHFLEYDHNQQDINFLIGYSIKDTENNKFYSFGFDNQYKKVYFLSEILNYGMSFSNFQIMDLEEFKNSEDLELIFQDKTGILRTKIPKIIVQ